MNDQFVNVNMTGTCKEGLLLTGSENQVSSFPGSPSFQAIKDNFLRSHSGPSINCEIYRRGQTGDRESG